MTSTDAVNHCAGFREVETVGRYRSRCAIPLDRIEAETATPTEVYGQRRLFDYLSAAHHDPHQHIAACGIATPTDIAVQAALELIDNLAGRIPSPATHSDQIRYAITAAIYVLDQRSPHAAIQAGHRVGAFKASDGPAVPLGPASLVRRRPRNALLITAMLSQLGDQISPPSRLMFRHGSDSPFYPDGWSHEATTPLHATQNRPALSMASIPQLLWPGALSGIDSDELDLHTPVGRAAASLALARYATDRPWKVIATGLGLPGSAARQCRAHWRRIDRIGCWPEYLAAIDQLFHQLHDRPPPIDYHRRRVIDIAIYNTAAQKVLATKPNESWRTRATLVRAYWHVSTGSSLHFAPATIRGADAYVLRHAESIGDEQPQLLAAMHRSVGNLLPGYACGPLSWQPP
ncbi:hypothetical protein [Nocardia terpenica]|uniref:hypothetical protein n=1 Tax=Nocardia terpenica TaxID=455432 RepID=UPI001EEA08B9|nr:hypothetical protein [Nocardia terpenica]